jgi:hypothetical protein
LNAPPFAEDLLQVRHQVDSGLSVEEHPRRRRRPAVLVVGVERAALANHCSMYQPPPESKFVSTMRPYVAGSGLHDLARRLLQLLERPRRVVGIESRPQRVSRL